MPSSTEKSAAYAETSAMAAHLRTLPVTQSESEPLPATSSGDLSVLNNIELQLIYRLLNGHEFIRNLTFSPNGQRFYDIRESTCNIWEPDALVRPDEKDLEDTSSVAESYAATEPIISHDESSLNHVTAFAMGPDDRYYCCGKEDGSVVIYDSTEGKKLRKVCSHSTTSSVISMAWSQSGKYIVSSDDSGRIISKRLESKDGDKWAVFSGMDFRIGEIVQQFVFSNDEKLLLISTPSKNIVWNLKGKKELCSKPHQLGDDGRWVADHMSPGILLWISCDRVSSYHWNTLESSEIDPSPQSDILKTGNESKARIREIVLSNDKRSLIYETLHTPSTDGPRLSILSTSSLSHSWQVDLSGQVKRLIGTFQNSLVFLDHDYWICTWELEARSSDVKRHFFLPRDWLNTSTLQMATINDQGTFFCPKFGDVIIVRNGFKEMIWESRSG